MKKTLRNFYVQFGIAVGLLVICIFTFSPPAPAQPAGRYSGLQSVTITSNAVGASTGYTNAIAAGSSRIDVPQTEKWFLYISYKTVSASVSNVTFYFRPMVDETTVASNGVVAIVVVTSTGVSPVNYATNFANVEPYPYWQFVACYNTNTAAMTNLAIQYGFKK